MAKINGNEAPEAITKIQLLTKTSTENSTPLANIQLDLGEPLFDPNNTEGKHLHIGTGENKISFYDSAKIDTKISAESSIRDADIKNLAGAGRTAETVKANADAITALKNIQSSPDKNFVYDIGINAAGNLQVSQANFISANNNLTISPDSGGNVTFTVPTELSGNIASASTVKTAATSAANDHYITFVSNNNTAASKQSVHTASKLKFNPSSGNIQAEKFNGATISETQFNGATISSTEFNGTTISSDDAAATYIRCVSFRSTGDLEILDPTDGSTRLATLNSAGLTFTWSGSKVEAGSFNATSDARLKENFQPLTPEKSILDLPTYKFDFINGAKNQIGCKAQDLQEICPEIVNEGDNGYLSIQESKIVYLLLEEVKKLRKEIDALKSGD